MKIVKLKPIFKDNLWGGNSLVDRFDLNYDQDILAEMWFLSGLEGDSNVIEESKTLRDYIIEHGRKVLGKKSPTSDELPLLIKIIDAKDDLSIQVHPNDEQAQAIGQPFGKNEMWHVLDTKDNNQLIFGLKEEMTEKQLQDAIKNNTVIDNLQHVQINKDDNLFVKAGTIHAIKADTIIFEVQQSSDTTYRLYDYDRKDPNGNLRELHIEEGVAVSSLNAERESIKKSKTLINSEQVLLEGLIRNEFFNVFKATIKENFEFKADIDSFTSLVVLDGTGTVFVEDEKLRFKAGDSFFVPANTSTIHFEADATVMITQL